MPLEFSYLFCPSMGLPACFRVLSNVFPPTLPLSCGFETPAVLLAVAFTASPPLMMAADMAAPRMVKGKCYAMSTSRCGQGGGRVLGRCLGWKSWSSLIARSSSLRDRTRACTRQRQRRSPNTSADKRHRRSGAEGRVKSGVGGEGTAAVA